MVNRRLTRGLLRARGASINVTSESQKENAIELLKKWPPIEMKWGDGIRKPTQQIEVRNAMSRRAPPARRADLPGDYSSLPRICCTNHDPISSHETHRLLDSSPKLGQVRVAPQLGGIITSVINTQCTISDNHVPMTLERHKSVGSPRLLSGGGAGICIQCVQPAPSVH